LTVSRHFQQVTLLAAVVNVLGHNLTAERVLLHLHVLGGLLLALAHVAHDDAHEDLPAPQFHRLLRNQHFVFTLHVDVEVESTAHDYVFAVILLLDHFHEVFGFLVLLVKQEVLKFPIEQSIISELLTLTLGVKLVAVSLTEGLAKSKLQQDFGLLGFQCILVICQN